MNIDISVTGRFPYKINLDDLEEFIRKARELGLNEATWNAYAGDQREPSQLTITAKR